MLVAEKRLTVRDFLQMQFEGEDEAYYELINGEIVKKAAPTPLHQEISQNLNFLMSGFVRSRKLGKIFAAPTDVFLDNYNHVMPDLLFIRHENAGIIDYKNGIVGVPDLVVEILSPGTAMIDRIEKRNAYQTAGVREYWLIDPNNRAVEVYENRAGSFEPFSYAEISGRVQSNVLPGFEVEIGEIFPNH